MLGENFDFWVEKIEIWVENGVFWVENLVFWAENGELGTQQSRRGRVKPTNSNKLKPCQL